MRDTKTTCSTNFKKLVQNTCPKKNVLENLVKKLVRKKTCSRKPVQKKIVQKTCQKKKLDKKNFVRKKLVRKYLLKTCSTQISAAFFLERFFSKRCYPLSISDRWISFFSGFEFVPRCGDAVIWSNVDAHGKSNPDMVHQGMPPESGVKMAINIWARDKPFTSPKQAVQRQH